MPTTDQPHVFVTAGDLTRLACDAWLLPTDESRHVTGAWRDAIGTAPSPPPEWSGTGVRAIVANSKDGDPRLCVWTIVGAWQADIAWYVEGATAFVRTAAAALRATPGERPWRRPRPLLGLPLVGTGAGGAGHFAGDIVGELLPALQRAADEHDVDVCLVTHGAQAYAAAQAFRKQHASPAFEAVAPSLRAEAERLAAFAVRGELVLFLGAGVSAGAGLPTWDALLEALAHAAGLTEHEREQLRRLSPLDRARLVQSRLGEKGGDLGTTLRSRLSAPWEGLAHTLLASLPVAQAATTNYDQLFERAAEGAGQECAVLPYAPSRSARRWLLKLHGCLSRPEDIVLTRDDYLRFSEQRAALAGIVQALLITRHMLFVGFSLQDDNFHRIVYDVRKALPSKRDAAGQFGTALLLGDDPLLAELWHDNVRVVALGAGQDKERAARQVEVFLDYLGMHAADATAHLLDRAFERVLTPAESALADALRRLGKALTPEARKTAAGVKVKRLLRDLGEGSGLP